MKINRSVLKYGSWVLIALIVLFLISAAFFPYENMNLDTEDTIDYSSGWSVVGENGEAVPIDISNGVMLKQNGEAVIRKTIGGDLPEPAVICIRTSHEKLKVKLSGQEIYEYGCDESLYATYSSPPSAWNIIRIPQGSEGKTIELTLSSELSRYSVQINRILVGTKASILFYIVKYNAGSVIFAAILFLVGAALIFIDLFALRKVSSRRVTLYLGLVTVCIALWSFGENKIIQVFSGNLVLSSTVTVVSLMLIPVFIAKYVYSLTELKYGWLLKAAEYYALVQSAVLIVLHVFTGLDIYQMLSFIQIAIVITSLIVVAVLLYNRIAEKKKELTMIIVSLTVLFAFAIVEIAVYCVLRYSRTSQYVLTGFLIFVLLQVFNIIQDIVKAYRKGRMASFYEWQAHKDPQTKCMNRRAYEERTASVTDDELRKITVAVADINGLKEINDGYGHSSGDKAIIDCADALENTFGHYGVCYRIGGDEFVFIGTELTPEKTEELAESFKAIINSAKSEFPFSAAVGYAAYDAQEAHDASIDDVIDRADANMYNAKAEMKSAEQRFR